MSTSAEVLTGSHTFSFASGRLLDSELLTDVAAFAWIGVSVGTHDTEQQYAHERAWQQRTVLLIASYAGGHPFVLHASNSHPQLRVVTALVSSRHHRSGANLQARFPHCFSRMPTSRRCRRNLLCKQHPHASSRPALGARRRSFSAPRPPARAAPQLPWSPRVPRGHLCCSPSLIAQWPTRSSLYTAPAPLRCRRSACRRRTDCRIAMPRHATPPLTPRSVGGRRVELRSR